MGWKFAHRTETGSFSVVNRAITKGFRFPLVLLSAADCVFVFLWQIPSYSTIFSPAISSIHQDSFIVLSCRESSVFFVARQTWHSPQGYSPERCLRLVVSGGFKKGPPLVVVHSE
ncbi:hypothetical protein CEXT_210231 [Caerostris extrusa]|uniref:Uncharacterized protein n=1 Tax=Caerostris extrusa TaxID=172846 RepID=A0AAV4XIW4_CAEEX|nr:hypothetical protein CEXT_210231 [Caerostris extrusa]